MKVKTKLFHEGFLSFWGRNHHVWQTYRSFKFKLTISENHLSNPNSTSLLVSSTTAWNPETLKNHLKLARVFSVDSWLRFETSSPTEHWIAIKMITASRNPFPTLLKFSFFSGFPTKKSDPSQRRVNILTRFFQQMNIYIYIYFFPPQEKPTKINSTSLGFCWGGKKIHLLMQPKMLRSLARCPISHTLSAAESRFGEEKSHRSHLQAVKNGISNCYVNGVSNVYIYIYVCVCLCKYIYAIRLHTNVYILYIYICAYLQRWTYTVNQDFTSKECSHGFSAFNAGPNCALITADQNTIC